MRIVAFLVLSLWLFCAGADTPTFKEQLLNDTFKHASLYAATPHTHTVRSIAVFLLASLRNAVELGETRDNAYDYFVRMTAARRTWAAKAAHFYGVTGAGEAETRIFNRGSCSNMTQSQTQKFHQLYNCRGNNVTVSILHLPNCDGSSWGPKGPCCRCNGAMSFFLDMIAHHHPGRAPSWFIFSDDDYFVRLHYLEAQLLSYQSPQVTPYSITLWGLGDKDINKIPSSGSNNKRQGRSGFGLGDRCNVACTHRFPWMGFGGFSVAALQALASQIRQNALVAVCDNFQLTHDIGLGAWTWMQQLPAIRVVEHVEVMEFIHGMNKRDFEPALYHNHYEISRMSFSELFSKTVGSSNSRLESDFDVNSYVDREEKLGRDVGAVLLPLMNNGGFRNTLYARRREVHNSILNSLTYNSSDPEFDPGREILVWNYTVADCDSDKKMFEKFLGDRDLKYDPVKESHICLKYSEYVKNIKVEGFAEELLKKDRNGDSIL